MVSSIITVMGILFIIAFLCSIFMKEDIGETIIGYLFVAIILLGLYVLFHGGAGDGC